MAYTKHAESAGSPAAITSSGIVLGTTGDTTAGNFMLSIDLSSMAAGDIIELRWRTTPKSGGTKAVSKTLVKCDAQSAPNVTFGPFVAEATSGTAHGWDFFAIKLAGTDRSPPWTIQIAT